MVVAALDVDRLLVTPLELAHVIGHVRHKVGVAAIGLAHDTVFVVAILGGAQPQRTVLFIGFSSVVQARNGSIHPAIGIQAGL